MLGCRIAAPCWRAGTPVVSDSVEITEACIQTGNAADGGSKGVPIREVQ